LNPNYLLIGDIHGCIEEFQKAIDYLIYYKALTDETEIVYCGDLIHKGPDSVAVVDFAIELSTKYKTTLVLGNHEEKHLRWLHNEEQRILTGKVNKMKHVQGYPSIRFESKHIDFMKNSVLFYKLQTPDPRIVVHGGIPPIIKTLPEENKISWYETIDSRDRKFYYQLLRTRYVNPSGHMVALGQETDRDTYWASIYDGRFGHAYFGHQPFMEYPQPIFPNATQLDLGCVYGSFLRIASIRPQFSPYLDMKFTFAAKQPYAEPLNLKE
jgi:hypothetical protein